MRASALAVVAFASSVACWSRSIASSSASPGGTPLVQELSRRRRRSVAASSRAARRFPGSCAGTARPRAGAGIRACRERLTPEAVRLHSRSPRRQPGRLRRALPGSDPGRPCRSRPRPSGRAGHERGWRRSGACRRRRLAPGASRASPLARWTVRGVAARARPGRRRAGPCRRTRRAAWRGRRPARGRRPGRAGCRRGSAAGVSRRRLLCPDAGRALATSAQIFSSDVLPTKFVISQWPSIFATSRLPAVSRCDLPGLDVDEVTLEVERAAVSVDGDLELVCGMVGQPVRRRARTPSTLNQTLRIWSFPVTVFPGPNVPVALGANSAHHLVDVLLGDRLVEGPFDLADRVDVGVLLESWSEAELPLEPPQAESAKTRMASTPPIKSVRIGLLLLPGPQG